MADDRYRRLATAGVGRLFRQFSAPGWLLLLNWVWCIGIVYSTLATRQHVALDVAGGVVLGGLAACLSLRRRQQLESAGKICCPSVK